MHFSELVFLRQVVIWHFILTATFSLSDHILNIPKRNTTKFGLKSISYLGPKIWNSLSDDFRTTSMLNSFRKLIFNVDLSTI